MNYNEYGILSRENIDEQINRVNQNKKASTILKLNNVEVFKCVDFLVDFQPQIVNPLMSVLDIGTRIGSAIKRFNQRGFKKTKGIDMSPGAIKNALKYGFNVWTEDIVNPLPFKQDSYDIIFCRHVLEHVTDLQTALKNMNKKMNRQGIIFLIVPVYKPEDEIITTHNFQFIEDNSLKNLVTAAMNISIIHYDIHFGSEREMWLIGKNRD